MLDFETFNMVFVVEISVEVEISSAANMEMISVRSLHAKRNE